MNLYRRIRSDPHEWFTDEQIAESRLYNRGRQWIAWVNNLVFFASVIGLIATRAVERASGLLGTTNWVAQVTIGVLITVVSVTIITLPVDLWSHAHERRWEFTDRSTRDWLVEQAKGTFLLAVPMYLILFVPLVALIRATQLWWIWGWLLFTAFGLVMSAIYPLVIMPLFNTFTPVEDESLRERIRRLARESGVDVGLVLTMDASKQTRKDNAFFAGYGRAKRVVLYDNLLKQSPREVDAVLAHEISHWRRRHLFKTLAFNSLVVFVIFAALRGLSEWRPLLDLANVESFGDPAALPLVMLLLISGLGTLGFVTSWQARAHERQADLDSLEFTRDAKTYLETHHNLATRNLGELEPSWWHRVRATHPPPAERLALGKWWQAQRLVTVLFTDIEDSTQIIERLGDEGWFRIRRDHDEIVRGKVSEHRGTEVDSAGDGFLIVFDDAGEALLCAIEVQRELADYNRTNETRVGVRMGLHSGEVIRKDGAVFGRDVVLAARVSAQARGGEIAVSDAVKRALEHVGRFTFVDPCAVELKGLAGTHVIHRVDWHDAKTRTD